MDERTKVLVRARAEGRCEYCQILQSLYPDFVFHVEHVVARQHGGVDLPSNLALACHLCNGVIALQPGGNMRYFVSSVFKYAKSEAN